MFPVNGACARVRISRSSGVRSRDEECVAIAGQSLRNRSSTGCFENSQVEEEAGGVAASKRKTFASGVPFCNCNETGKP